MATSTINNIRKSLAKARQKARNTVKRMTQPLVKDGTVEVHYFTPGEDPRYIVGGVISQGYEFDTDKILIDHAEILETFNIRRGNFNATVNIHNPILGSADYPMIFLKEISPDRRELRFEHVAVPDNEHSEHEGMLREFVDAVNSGMELVINFGQNQLFKIINEKIFEDHDLVVRLLDPLPNDIEEESTAWIVNELSDSFDDDDIIIQSTGTREEFTELRGPNFEIETTYGTITETDFESWNTLLDASTGTSQDIVDRIFSGSLSGTQIGIDYSGFENFIHFSSAAERIANFKYKIELIEYYDSQIGTLNAASGSDTTALQNNVTVNINRKNDIIGSFDAYERWLYNEPTASLFTDHALYTSEEYEVEGGRIGAKPYRIEPWPKALSNGSYRLIPSTQALATTWYNGAIASASLYDVNNDNALVKTIPEHIRIDSNNSQYELFVNMIGHHYDIIYSYIDNLSKTYKLQEHPKLGHSKDTLYEIAKSLGWSLTDGKQASSLWQYKLGVDSGSGAYQSTGTLFSKSDEAITAEVWRRIVNNLPYLLKTKGTARSVKALMNTYGIPQTLLSIREYGGPKVSEDVPTLIEDRFTYALQFESASINGTKSPHIRFGNHHYQQTATGWGINRPELVNNIPAQTREFRFRPAVKESMLLQTHTFKSGTVDRITYQLAVEYTGSYSGSDKYGRLVFSHGLAYPGSKPVTGSTDYLPLYDGDFWNVRLFWQTTGSGAGIYNHTINNNTTYHIQTQKASDYISDKIIHKTSASYTPTENTHFGAWSSTAAGNSRHYAYVGGFPGSGQTHSDVNRVNLYLRRFLGETIGGDPITSQANISSFSGSMQEYREWLEDIGQTAFDLHTKNPTSYVSGISSTSSFDTLVRHYPLGTNLNAVDHSLSHNIIISSSHPAQHLIDFQPTIHEAGDDYNLLISGSTYATMSNFPTAINAERGNYEPVVETYYVQGVSLGGNLPRSQKIRLEDNELIRSLSPTNTAERSRFDRAPLDTNRVGLFYSMADQINKEIFNQIGDVELDDFVGNPEDEFKTEYPNLNEFAINYWKKYTDRNDINAYMRIFSQFDFALFNQIKQLLPERVDEVSGLLVEPHALERTKVHVTKRPAFTNPQYKVTINDQVPSASGEYILNSASINVTENILSATSIYHTGSNDFADTGNYLFNVQVMHTGSNSGSVNEGFVLSARSSSIFNSITYFYSSPESQSLGIYSSRSLGIADYRDDEFIMTENQKFNGSRISAPGINIASSYPQLNFEPIVQVFAVNPNQLIYNETPPPNQQGTIRVQ